MAGDGPVAIIAGPGTGKTKTLVARVRFLLESGVSPATILALTFTKKAADEMRARVGAVPGVNISTFHGLCFDILREKTGIAPQFVDDTTRTAIIKSLPKQAVFNGLTSRDLSLIISRVKNGAEHSQPAVILTAAYDQQLAARGLHDFDDLLLQTRDLLRTDTAWRTALQARFAQVLVDEFQDTNSVQYDILRLLVNHANIFVIGDPQQSIYGFRGAGSAIFATFLHDFIQATRIVLDTNYRSAPQIVALANALYPQAPALQAYRHEPGVAQAVEVLNEYREADWVLAEIQKAIGGSDLQRAVSDDQRTSHRALRDIAILYRSRRVARAMQQAIEASGLPYQIVGDGSPYETPQVQLVIQILAHLDQAERQVSSTKFTAQQVATLLQKIDRAASPQDIARQVAHLFALPIEAPLRHVFGVLLRFSTLAGAVQYFDDIAAQDFYDPQADMITLLTIHAAKGLEFDQVFLVGAEDGVLPSARGDEAEEKRLFYVAVTRAKQRLDILHARKRAGEAQTLSRFAQSVAPEILPRTQDVNLVRDQRTAQKRQARRAQATLF